MISTETIYLTGNMSKYDTGNPGCFYFISPSGRVGRNRDDDRLFLQLHFVDGYKSDYDYLHSFEIASEYYYGTSGSITAASRAAISVVNQHILDLNRAGGSSPPIQAGLTCAVLRNEDLYVTQAGPGKVVIIRNNNFEQIPDNSIEMRSVGMSDQVILNYFHTTVDRGDLLWMSMYGISDENASEIVPRLYNDSELISSISNMSQSEHPSMLCRFCDESEVNYLSSSLAAIYSVNGITNGVVTEDENGNLDNGNVEYSEVEASEWATDVLGSIESEEKRVIDDSNDHNVEMGADDYSVNGITNGVVTEDENGNLDNGNVEDDSNDVAYDFGTGIYEGNLSDLESSFDSKDKSKNRLLFITKFYNEVVSKLIYGLELCRVGIARMAPRLLPETDSDVRIPGSVMLWLAAGVPVAVVIFTIFVYVQFGKVRQFNYYVEQARIEAGFASSIEDPIEAVPHWRQVLLWTDLANQIRNDHPDVEFLEKSAISVIDVLDSVERIDVTAIDLNYDNDIPEIQTILARGSSVYTLDVSNQVINRSVLTTSGTYQTDPIFECSNGNVGNQVINKIVDIAWLDQPNVVEQDTLIALDSSGIIVYCTSDGAMAATLLTPPYEGWQQPSIIEAFQDRIYILDPLANEIWVFQREDKFYGAPPERYFTESAIDLSDAIDISIVQGTINILHSNGNMTECIRKSQEEPPICNTKIMYIDGRVGKSNDVVFENIYYPHSMIAYPPPYSSIYLTDSKSKGVFQFSLRLAYQREFRAILEENPVETIVFAVGPGRDLFFASKNNLYVGKRS